MKFGIIANLTKKQALELTSKLVSWLKNKNQEVFTENDFEFEERLEKQTELVKKSDLIISLGGDGTILSTAKIVGQTQKPILGVNLGRLGFLTETNLIEIYEHLEKIIEGDFEIDKRFLLQGNFKGKKFFALNDFVIEKGKFTRLIEIKVEINGTFVNTYLSDGVIISTPTGSTAYSLSCGGPIVTPDTEIVIVTAVSSHNLTTRPLVFPSSNQVSILLVACENSATLSADGMFVNNVKKGEILKISKANFSVNLVRCSKRSFYDVLRTKLSWGEDSRSSFKI